MQKPILNDNSNHREYTPGQRLKILSQISAWLLAASAVIIVFSGWGITHTEIIYKATFGLIDRRLANYIHRSTNIPLAIFFLSHLFINIRLTLFRKIPHRIHIFDAILIFVGILLILLVIYMEFWA
jgi:cytochrome b subunit of formate dehydrogenase